MDACSTSVICQLWRNAWTFARDSVVVSTEALALLWGFVQALQGQHFHLSCCSNPAPIAIWLSPLTPNEPHNYIYGQVMNLTVKSDANSLFTSWIGGMIGDYELCSRPVSFLKRVVLTDIRKRCLFICVIFTYFWSKMFFGTVCINASSLHL